MNWFTSYHPSLQGLVLSFLSDDKSSIYFPFSKSLLPPLIRVVSLPVIFIIVVFFTVLFVLMEFHLFISLLSLVGFQEGIETNTCVQYAMINQISFTESFISCLIERQFSMVKDAHKKCWNTNGRCSG